MDSLHEPPARARPPAEDSAYRSALVVVCRAGEPSKDRFIQDIAESLAQDPPPATSITTSDAPAGALVTRLPALRALVVVHHADAPSRILSGHCTRFVCASANLPTDEPLLAPLLPGSAPWAEHFAVGDALLAAEERRMLPAAVWVYEVAPGDLGPEWALADSRQVTEQIVRDIRADLAAWQALTNAPTSPT
jgi:hypothetical protein